MDFEDKELIQSFVSESQDLIDDVEPLLLSTRQEGNGVGKDAVHSIFRLFHSIKGSAGFLKMANIAAITHEAETLLDFFRHHDLILTAYYVDTLLKAIDTIRSLLRSVSEHNTDAGHEAGKDALLRELRQAVQLAENLARMPQEKAPAARQEVPIIALTPEEEIRATVSSSSEETGSALAEFIVSPEMAARFSQEAGEALDRAEQCLLNINMKGDAEKADALSEAFRHLHSFKGNCGFMRLRDMENVSHRLEAALEAFRDGRVLMTEQNEDILLRTFDILRQGLSDFNKGGDGTVAQCDIILDFLDELLLEGQGGLEDDAPADDVALPGADETVVVEKAGTLLPAGAEDHSRTAERNGDSQKKDMDLPRQNIRVDVQKLDALINLVGELVIAEAMVLRNPALLGIEDEKLDRSIHHLRRVSSELQDVAMSVRMVPLSATFRKLIRVVHDLSRRSGKKADIALIGEETEVDKNVIEQINDPLVHVIRNAIDHGLEAPETRVAAGKPEKGSIVIEAKHEGGEVWIIVRDDGRGLDREKILRKGIERGLVDGDGRDLRDEEVFELIFEPGFSTADAVTDISGRGVGMDVVKKNLERLKGRAQIRSVKGQGTDVIFQIPLTLAIIDGMLVQVGDTQYTLPILSIRESIRVDEEKIAITPDGRESILLRNEVIPILRLSEIYAKKAAVTDIRDGILVIVETDKCRVALLVDAILGQQQTVIKGLSAYLGNPIGISGCTVLGDGEVSLIIDVSGLLDAVEQRGRPIRG